ncbi:MAG: ATP-binding protein [Bacteroidales bacterium]|nr:ATP-binding protein [Bacteroidales bacterium]
MDFIGRKEELLVLDEEYELSKRTARFTIVFGRRRIGKTSLIQKSLDGKKHLYVLAKNEAEATFCSRLQQQIETELAIPVFGRLQTMKDVFEVLFKYAATNHLCLVIDEIQEFFYVRKSIFADMQELWDKYKSSMHIDFIACGSIYSLMKELFEDRKQAMYGRITRKIDLKALKIQELKQVLSRYSPQYKNEDLLCLYAITGGIPKYVEMCVERNACNKASMLQNFCDVTQPFVGEGSDLMNMEFRREGAVYYSILSLIADGKNTISEMESVLQIKISAYLQNLEINYSLIRKVRPLFASERSQGIRYRLADNFLAFWFRFIYPNQNLVVSGRSDMLLRIVEDGYNVFSGKVLERYFLQKADEESDWTTTGQWWDSKGENEIDFVACSSLTKKAMLAEIKINRNKISLSALQTKSEKLRPKLKGYDITLHGLSLEDM